MSCFICSDRHIATIASYFTSDIGFEELEVTQRIADLLLEKNIEGVNFRYKEDTEFTPVDLSEVAQDMQPQDLVALCDCLDYQSCDPEGYINPLLDDITAHFKARVVGSLTSNLWSI